MSYTLSTNLSSQQMCLFSSEGENSLDTNISPNNSLDTDSPSNFLTSHFDNHMDDYELFSTMDHSDDLFSNDLFSTDTSPSYGLVEDIGIDVIFNELDASSLEVRRDEARATERMRKESLSALSNNVPPQVVEPQFQLVPMNSNREVGSSNANAITNKENAERNGSSQVIDTITIYSSDEEQSPDVERFKMEIEKTKREESKMKRKKPLAKISKGESIKERNKPKTSSGWQRGNIGACSKPKVENTIKKKTGWQRSQSSSWSNSNVQKVKKTPVIEAISSSAKKLPKSGWQRASSYDSATNIPNTVKSSNVNSSSKSGWRRPLSSSRTYPDHERISKPSVAVEEHSIASIKHSPTIFEMDSAGLDLSMVKEEAVFSTETVIQDSLIHSNDVGNEVIIDAPPSELFEPFFEPKIEKDQTNGIYDQNSSSSEKQSKLSNGIKHENVVSSDFDNLSSLRPRSSSTVRDSLPVVNQTSTNILNGLGRHQKKIKGFNEEIRESIASGANGSFLDDINGLNDSVLSDISSSLDISNKLETSEEKEKTISTNQPEEKLQLQAENKSFSEGCFTDPIAARTRRGVSHTTKQTTSKSNQKKVTTTKPSSKEDKVKTEANTTQSETSLKTNNTNAKSCGGKKKKPLKKPKGKCIRTIEENLKHSDSPIDFNPSVKTESSDKVCPDFIIEDAPLSKEQQLECEVTSTSDVQKETSFSCLEDENLEDLPDDFLLRGLSDCINHPSVDSAMKVLINEIEIGAPNLFQDATKSSFMSIMNDPFGGLNPLDDISLNSMVSSMNDEESLLPMVNPSNVLQMTHTVVPSSGNQPTTSTSNGKVQPTNITSIGKVQPTNITSIGKVLPANLLKKEELVDPIESPLDHTYAISPKKGNKSVTGLVDIKPGSPVIKLNFDEEPSECKSVVVKSENEANGTQGNIINKLPGYLSDSIKVTSSTKKKIDINQYKKRKSLADNIEVAISPSVSSAQPDNKYSSLDSMLSKKSKTSNEADSSSKKSKQKSKSKKSSSKKKKATESSKDSSTLNSKQAMYDELNRDCEGLEESDVNRIKKMILQAKLKQEKKEITQKLAKVTANRCENGSNSFGSEIIKNMTRSSVERTTSSRSSSVHPTSRSSSRQYYSNDCDRLYSSDEKRTSKQKKSKRKHRKRSKSPRRRERRYYDSDESEYERSRSKKKRKRRSYSRSISSSSCSSSSSSESSHSSHRKSKRSKRRHSCTSSSSSRPYSRSSSHYPEAPYSPPPYSCACHGVDPHVTNCRHYTYNYPQYSTHYSYCSQYPSDYRQPHRRSLRHEQEGVDRNVLHIGNITQGTTREYIRERFSKFGRIVEVRMPVFVYDDKNFGFVKFSSYAECARAIENGNDNEPIKFELCFGNRREFCKQKYKDLDALPDDQVYVVKPNAPTYYAEPDSYDAMLSEFKMMKNNR